MLGRPRASPRASDPSWPSQPYYPRKKGIATSTEIWQTMAGPAVRVGLSPTRLQRMTCPRAGSREDWTTVEQRLVKLLGTSAKHILVALERTFRAVALTGLITFIVILVGVEAVAYLLTHEFPPTGATHLAAAALAVAFAYAAAITVALVEILRGIIRAIELIVEESEKLAGAALREGETLIREGGEEVGRVARGAIGEAESIGRGVAGGAAAVGGAVAGAVGGVGSAVGREARAVESRLPGQHSGSGGSGSESSGSR